MQKKKKRWIKPRHKFTRNFVAFALWGYIKCKYHIKYEKFKDDKRAYLILYNHQTAFDQFFIGSVFKKPVYYVASEDLFSNGFISSVIRYLVAPIPIKKQTTDPKAVMDCFRVAREGGSIAIAPEGNRTYSGTTEYMNGAIVPLVRRLKLPLVLFRIEGGYGVQPRWTDKNRKGKMTAKVSRILEVSEVEKLTDEQLFYIIKTQLYVDEREITERYTGKRLAEHLERVAYVCPDCGLSRFVSKGNLISCEKCGKTIEYLPNKQLKGVNCDFPFTFVKDWYDYQKQFIIKTDLSEFKEKPIWTEKGNLFSVELYKRKKLLKKKAEILLYYDKLRLDDKLLPFDEISTITVLGRNKLNVYYKDNLYQVKSYKGFNALKFVNVYYKYKEMQKSKNGHVEFLGL